MHGGLALQGREMKCSSCHRPILRPALELGGATYGPVCARKVLVAAGRMAPPKKRAPVDPAHRDDRTVDMFEGATK